MGDIADMMLDGTLCECCGVYIGPGEGFLRYCSNFCRKDRQGDSVPLPKATTCKCPTCGKKVKLAGLNDHNRDVHGAK